MSEQKKRIGLWLNVSKSGNKYLQGRDRISGDRYFVFSDAETGVKNVKIKRSGSEGFDETFNVSLSERSNDRGSFHIGGGMLLSENMFYFDDKDPESAIGHIDGNEVRYITNKEGSLVLNKDGEPIEKPSHTLLIG